MAFDKALSALFKLGKTEAFFQIHEEWLMDEEILQYHFIREYIIDNHELPPVSVFNSRFHVQYPVSCGRLAYHLKELKERHLYVTLADKIPSAIKKLKADPEGALSDIQDIISRVQSTDSMKDIRYHEQIQDRFDRYQLRVGNQGVTYLSTGNKVLDEMFYGYQQTDLITIGGRSGLGKTWLLCLLALICEASLPDHLGPVLFLTKEKSADEIIDRCDYEQH